LHVGHEEDEPIKAAQAPARRPQRLFGFVRLLAGRLPFGGNAATSIVIVAIAA